MGATGGSALLARLSRRLGGGRRERGIGLDEARRYEELSRSEHHSEEERYGGITVPVLGAVGRMSLAPEIDALAS